MRIRGHQLKAFEQLAQARFEQEMVAHLLTYAPRHCEVIGERRLAEVVRLGVERGARYGLTNRGPLRFYLEMMISLGSAFDTDPQYPWAGAILSAPDVRNQMERADRLYDLMLEYSGRVFGPDYRFETNAIRRLWHLDFDAVARLAGAPEVIRTLNCIYPEKVAFVGLQALVALAESASRAAAKYQLAPDLGAAVILGVQFCFGHAAPSDPQFPWIGSTLDREHLAAGVADSRAQQLLRKLKIYLERGTGFAPAQSQA